MTYDTLASLAPSAPRTLLEKIAAALDEKPAADVLMLISEGLNEMAHEAEMDGQRMAGDLRELAKCIAPAVMRHDDEPPAFKVGDTVHLRCIVRRLYPAAWTGGRDHVEVETDRDMIVVRAGSLRAEPVLP